ncbi:MAG: aminotransferase class V-fold PLP-dependent enzyme [Phycisphaerales bacterium JB063]
MTTADQLDAQYPAISPDAWGLDPDCTFLNHGSFGAAPRVVLDRQKQLRERMERNPLRFLLDEAPPLVEHARQAVAKLINAQPEDVVFVRNATAGVNVVLRSLRFEPGDEILYFNHAYNACANVVRFVADRWGAKPVRVDIPWPIEDPQQVIDAVDAAVTDQTRLAMLDHITSGSGLVLPIAQIIAKLKAHGIDTLVDAAHAPGMVPIDVQQIGAAYYTANCHKWLCAPKSAAFLHIPKDKQPGIEPDVISHGSNAYGAGNADLQMRFLWPGTNDPTPVIGIADAIAFLESLLPGGLPALMQRNHDMAIALRPIVCDAWGIEPPCPASMLGSMATLPLFKGCPRWRDPDATRKQDDVFDRVQRKLKVEVPPIDIETSPDSAIIHSRFSCQAYNHGGQILRFIEAFRDVVDPAALTG